MTVLLADEIKKLCVDENGSLISKPLIEPFCPSRLRAASYQLTLGDQIHVGGEPKRLKDSEEIVIEPHQVAVVSTQETLRIPPDLIARWSLRVTNIYEGLLWTGGPQVDPGWEGRLFCPIYNLAERPVVLKCGDGLFTMDFVRTTPDSPALEELRNNPAYPKVRFEPVRSTLEQHDRHRLRSAPYEALRELRELRHFRNFGNIAVSLIMLVLTLMVAALAVIAGTDNVEVKIPLSTGWFWAIFGPMSFLSCLAIIISVYVLRKIRRLTWL